MKKFKVRVYCEAYYDSYCMVPDELTEEEVFEYAKEHINEIPVSDLCYIPERDELDPESIDLPGLFCFEEKKDSRLLITLSFNKKEIIYDPNSLVIAYYKGELDKLLENDQSLIDDISGKCGAIKYKSYKEEYCLNKETMLRLIARNLDEKEYKILVAKYGPYQFMIHDDFYTENGIAIQPIEK